MSKPPFTPGYEFVGTVDGLGDGVTGFELGEMVAAISVYGSHAAYLCVPFWWLVPVPAGRELFGTGSHVVPGGRTL